MRGPGLREQTTELTTAGVEELFGELEASGRFHRDSRLGGMFHPGKVSFREVTPTDSVHVVIEGNRVSTHVDRVSPLGIRKSGHPCRYSLPRILLHNLSGMFDHLVLFLRGRLGQQRCQLTCEPVWEDDQDEVSASHPLHRHGGG
ncbi:MAG: hypothetical protein ACRDZ9_00195 [Acidimicrobiales bacterium]